MARTIGNRIAFFENRKGRVRRSDWNKVQARGIGVCFEPVQLNMVSMDDDRADYIFDGDFKRVTEISFDFDSRFPMWFDAIENGKKCILHGGWQIPRDIRFLAQGEDTD